MHSIILNVGGHAVTLTSDTEITFGTATAPAVTPTAVDSQPPRHPAVGLYVTGQLVSPSDTSAPEKIVEIIERYSGPRVLPSGGVYCSLYAGTAPGSTSGFRLGRGRYIRLDEVFALRDSHQSDFIGAVYILPTSAAPTAPTAPAAPLPPGPFDPNTVLGKYVSDNSRDLIADPEIASLISTVERAHQYSKVITVNYAAAKYWDDGAFNANLQPDEYVSLYGISGHPETYRIGNSTFETVDEVLALKDARQSDFLGVLGLHWMHDPAAGDEDHDMMQYACINGVGGATVQFARNKAGRWCGSLPRPGSVQEGYFRSLYGTSPETLRLGSGLHTTLEAVFALRDSMQDDFVAAVYVMQ